MNVRRATAADEPALRVLWEEFEAEVPEPEGFEGETWEEEWRDTRRDIDAGAVYLAEDEEGVFGVARATRPQRGRSHLHFVHVSPRGRRGGVAKALLRECVREVQELGARTISLNVLSSNDVARNVWRRLGFDEYAVAMASPVDRLELRLEEASGPTEGAVYVQTDDEGRVAEAASRFLPRLGRPEGTQVATTGAGWVSVREPILDRDPRLLQRLAQELSLMTGSVTVALGIERGAGVRYAIYDRGGMVDEYLSVPELYGPLPPGDVIALGANPTVVARLTGADPARVKEVARTAASPSDLPPPRELRDELAGLMGLE